MEFLEFFAGGGMARLGLGESWSCSFANDFSEMKAATYRENHDGGQELRCCDIGELTATDIPGAPDLAWGSFPCQDLSLAGSYAGLKGERSALFWAFWKIVQGLREQGRPPKFVILENVYGTLTSHRGNDILEICAALSNGGYRFGPVVVDACHFLPQSRPRLFIIGVDSAIKIPESLVSQNPIDMWTPASLKEANRRLSPEHAKNWIWWNLPSPPPRSVHLSDIIEENPGDVPWNKPEDTEKIISMMSDANLKKLENAKKSGTLTIGTIYRRTRTDKEGNKVQRAEVRFDGTAGCLRTPKGGSSRQTIIVVKGDEIRTRLLSAREAARLMGLPDAYKLPKKYNDAYFIAGDGVAVPVVKHIADNIVHPIAEENRSTTRNAA